MPDASAENITCFLVWYVFSIFGGFWVSKTLLPTRTTCVDPLSVWAWIIPCLVPSVCMAIVCCTIFLLAPKYLIVEPKSPQSLKTIYCVLKFAAKHKVPINRSAFTYWEEDLPSRLDLGKLRYGGPFTTEQVEDVKTFFKILLTLSPVLLIFLAMTLPIDYGEYLLPSFTKTKCISKLVYNFTFDLWWAVARVAYEFGAYPIVKNKLPSTLKSIGIAAFFIC